MGKSNKKTGRNYIAKLLWQNPAYKPKVIPNKKRDRQKRKAREKVDENELE